MIMGDNVVSPGALLDPSIDFDYMDELFSDGCWLETAADGSDFLLRSPSASNPLFDPSFSWPALDTNGHVSLEQRQSPFIDDHQETRNNTRSVGKGKNMIDVADACNPSETRSVESSEVVKKLWIGPMANPSPECSVLERLIKALVYIRDFNRDKDMLLQIWVPVNKEGGRILSTCDLPFSLESSSPNLAKYREISARYHFSAEGYSRGLMPGLPGRVFKEKVPEWTPDVRFFRSDEYPRVDHAQEYDVRGSLALPVFGQHSNVCLGVIEVVMTAQQIKYFPELESVCKALQAVDLRSKNISRIQNVKACNNSYEAALPEIQEVLRSACEMHKLPLAQTWVACIKQGKEGCRHSDDNYLHCISPVEHACYVGDPCVQAFHEACSEHHLLKGQGVTGEAFLTNQPCFSTDVTSFSKIDYPLSHHARIFGLRAAVAIRLRSIHNSTDDFVLEFFLPVNCSNSEEQKKMLTSLSMIIQKVCHSLRVITNKELEEETSLSIDEVTIPAESRSARMDFQQCRNVTSPGTKEKSNEALTRQVSNLSQQEDSILKGNLDYGWECSSFGEGGLPIAGLSKTGDKRRTKAEKTITLQVLRQYFAGSLKDAAKNIGVCTTTLKRICRQHGIKRWPSRKIKKVGHSLQKLQLVIDSVQGASSAFQIDSFYSKFPELASPNLPGSSLVSTSKQSDLPNPSSSRPDTGLQSPEAPSSSCNQSSSSSHSSSNMSELQLHAQNVRGGKVPRVREDSGDGAMKRIPSEVRLKSLSQDTAELLPTSQSQEILCEPAKPVLKSSHKEHQKEDTYRVKVTLREEKTRFRMPKSWHYEDLLWEIAWRFNIDDMRKFYIKYLDDDSDWVLLTCDADLEECIDVCRHSQSSTIKLCLLDSKS
ncbi:protein NLP5 isoform X2 [Neltuma alba]|uniref:protein NLP5 isoform X2 n=1 Tax=Neltuma alba TaxID=207710 RepID=UPI0010A34EFD|nr:protein NLP5-like isoform X2 [Prosopis alba]